MRVRLLLPGLLLLAMTACNLPSRPAQSAKQATATCDTPACGRLVVSQGGSPSSLEGNAAFALPNSLAASRWKIDTGQPSLDGRWVAYTSISSESGGPVFLQDTQTGEWTNLIEALNQGSGGGKTSLPEDYLWDVIGWFPDSRQLLIGPVDLSLALRVDLATFTAQAITFPGNGRGGRQFAHLSPDGSRLLFAGDDAQGNQLLAELDLRSGAIHELLHLPYAEGIISNPRYAPGQSSLAYLVQSTPPGQAAEYAIDWMTLPGGHPEQLVEGNLDVCVPTWSPDGSSLAFLRKEGAQPATAGLEQAPPSLPSNVWVIQLASRQETQLTFLEEPVRSPTWASDNQTLAFVTSHGAVQLASLAQPGQLWQAADPAGPAELTSAFFLP